MLLKDPQSRVIYTQERATFDSYQFVAEVSRFLKINMNYGLKLGFFFQTTGIYAACFSNKFSSFSHKLVYVDFQVGEEAALPGIDEHATVLTQMESSSQTIHKSLNQILDAQTHHRLRESQGRKSAEILNERVMVWSLFETFCLLVIGAFQVMIVRNFFKERKPSQYRKL